jgi:hypothetical protein
MDGDVPAQEGIPGSVTYFQLQKLDFPTWGLNVFLTKQIWGHGVPHYGQ